MTQAAPKLFFDNRRESVLAAVLGGLILAAFLPTLVEFVRECWTHPEYGHGLLMPPVAAWLIWTRRSELAALRRRNGPANTWLPLAAAAAIAPLAVLLLLGEMKLSWFLKPYAFVFTAAAAVVVLWGWQGLRALAAPFVVLFLMCPLPLRVILWLTLPLKYHAAVLATGMLNLTGIQAGLEGNLIHVPGIESLWIADACSGLHSLISLVSVGVLACLFWKRHWSMKLVLLGSCVPIAIIVNGMRIWLTAILSLKVSPEAAQSFYHTMEGMLLFGVAALILWGWGVLLHKMVPARPESDTSARTPAPDDGPSRPRLRIVAFTVSCLLLAGAAWLVYETRAQLGGSRPDPEAVARLQTSLGRLPGEVREGYSGKCHEWEDEVIANSGADAYGAMIYTDQEGRDYQVYLGGALRNADNFHTPNVCMPSAGWEALEVGSVPFRAFPVAAAAPQMSRLVLQKGDARMLVFYWFQAGDRLANSEWDVRFQRLFDLIAKRPLRPTVLVTIYVPIRTSIPATEKAARQFLAAIGPHLKEVTTSEVIHG